jgi:hypothetical protein
MSASRKEINELYLNKKLCIIADKDKSATAAPLNVTASFVRNLEPLGFTVSKKLFNRLKTLDAKTLEYLQSEIVPVLKKMVGAHRRYKPMYPNFSDQVMTMSDAELWMNAWMHYAGSWISDVLNVPVRYLPEYEENDRVTLNQDEVTVQGHRSWDGEDVP